MKFKFKIHFFYFVFFVVYQTAFAAQVRGSSMVDSIAVQKGQIIEDVSMAYASPDFDSQVLSEFHRGEFVEISKQNFSGFYKVHIKIKNEDTWAWLPDSEVKPVANVSNNRSEAIAAKRSKADSVSTAKKTAISIDAQRWFALGLNFSNYREETMGYHPTAKLNFFSLRWFGRNTISDYETFTDTELQIYNSAPSYYGEGTGNTATGYIAILETNWLTEYPQSRNHMLFFGAGPFMRFSSYNVIENNTPYSLQDIVLGLNLKTGLAFRIGPVGVISDVKFSWDKLTYFSWENAVGISF